VNISQLKLRSEKFDDNNNNNNNNNNYYYYYYYYYYYNISMPNIDKITIYIKRHGSVCLTAL